MKNLLVSLFVLLVLSVSNPLYAQWAVADASNLAQNTKNFAELKKQVNLLNDQKNKLDEGLDMMRTVNQTISNSVTVKNFMERQIKLSDMCVEIFSKHKLSSTTAQTLTTSIAEIMANNSRMIALSKTILSTNVKMNDAERLTVLNDIEKKMKEDEQTVYKLSSLLSSYESIKSMLK